MKLSLYIAKRYLLAKKSRNAINIISGVSVTGVMTGTMALIIILSVFNGLEKMVTEIFGTFDPDVKITAARGKVFVPDTVNLQQLTAMPFVESYAVMLEENALLTYGERQFLGTLRGVGEEYIAITGLKERMWDGEFMLKDKQGNPAAVLGLGLANSLGVRLNFITPLAVYVPNRSVNIARSETAFNRRYLFPSGIFEIEQEFDSQHLFVPISLARELLGYSNEVTAIEVKLTPDNDLKRTTLEIRELFGPEYRVQNRFEQQELFYKVIKSERLAIYIILTFILIVASFNIIGSLTMLIIEKEKDIIILRNLGASDSLIRKIFIYEGWMISVAGAVTGLALGFIVCWVQQQFGLIKFQSESLVIDAYPVVMRAGDFLLVAVTVLLIGYLAAWYPVRYLSKKYLQKHNQ